MPITGLNGVELNWARGGSGPRLLYISGTGGDLRARPGVFDGPLPGRFDVLAYDQRGMGRSSKPDIPYTMADYADDAAALMDAVGWDDAMVIGVSFGGMVAQELTLRHPGKVSRLVLGLHLARRGGRAPPIRLHTITHLAGEARARFMIPLMDARLDAAWAEANPGAWAEALALGSVIPFADEPGREVGARRQIEARGGARRLERLAAIACPVLVTAGLHDRVALPRPSTAWRARFPARSCGCSRAGTISWSRTPRPCRRSSPSWSAEVSPSARAALGAERVRKAGTSEPNPTTPAFGTVVAPVGAARRGPFGARGGRHGAAGRLRGSPVRCVPPRPRSRPWGRLASRGGRASAAGRGAGAGRSSRGSGAATAAAATGGGVGAGAGAGLGGARFAAARAAGVAVAAGAARAFASAAAAALVLGRAPVEVEALLDRRLADQLQHLVERASVGGGDDHVGVALAPARPVRPMRWT